MKANKVPVERYVEQVSDGIHYKGYIVFAADKFDYELKFAVPIPQLDDLEPPKGREEIRRLFQITIKRDEANIELSDEEYGFFFQMITELAIELHDNEQTRANNEGFVGQALRGGGPMAGFGVSVKIGMKSSGSYDFPPEVFEMLNAPKFGCSLAV